MLIKMFYVYTYLDQNNIPFYVGKGNGNRYKIQDHSGKCNPFLQNKIRKIGVDSIKIEFPLKNVIEVDAFAYEELFIGIVGRRDLGLGPLCNLTNGGEGISGHNHSESTKQKISEKNKGKAPWSKGKLFTTTHRQRISNSKKGQLVSKEHRRKISKANKGQVPWIIGKQHSKETKQKMSKSHKGKGLGRIVSEETRCKLSKAIQGKKLSEETKRKISKTLKGNIPWNKGKKLSSEHKRKLSAAMKHQRRKKK